MRKKFVVFLILLFCFCTTSLAQESTSIFPRKDLQIDNSLNNEEKIQFALPQKILVTQLKSGNQSLANDTESWLSLLHYYSITRLGLPDIPFNYVIDRSGNIYEGLEGAEGRFPAIDAEQGTILIGYFSDSSDLTLAAETAFKFLVENYSYKYGIPKEGVQAVEIYFAPPEEGQEHLLSYKSAENMFITKFSELLEKFTYSEKSNLKFSGTIEDLKYPSSVNIGEEFKVEFKLKNTDTFPWYIDESFLFLSTADGENSRFAINQVWDSFTKPFALKSQVVLPGQSVVLEYNLDTSSALPDQYKEDFFFVTVSGEPVEGTMFSLEFEILKGESKIVRIRPTGTGALTVYGCPEYTCEMVAAAISGERYIVLEERERWYEISVDGVRGWITVHYADLVD